MAYDIKALRTDFPQIKRIIEYSTPEHPRLVLVKDGLVDKIPGTEFVQLIKKSWSLLDTSKEFSSFCLSLFTTRNDYNGYVDLVNKMNDQLNDFILNLKSRCAPIYFADPVYFMRRLEETKQEILKHPENSTSLKKELCGEFVNAVDASIRINEKTAEKNGVPLPKYGAPIPTENSNERTK